MEFVFSLMDVVTEKIIEFLYVWKYVNILQTLRSIHFLLCEENIQYSYGKPQKKVIFLVAGFLRLPYNTVRQGQAVHRSEAIDK